MCVVRSVFMAYFPSWSRAGAKLCVLLFLDVPATRLLQPNGQGPCFRRVDAMRASLYTTRLPIITRAVFPSIKCQTPFVAKLRARQEIRNVIGIGMVWSCSKQGRVR